MARDANRTIGSGMASIELLRRTLSRHGWLRDDQHGVFIAVSRLTPGTNVLAYLAVLGWMYHRAAGAAVAIVVGSLPGSIIITVMTAAAADLDRWPAVRVVLALATLVAGFLVLANAWSLVRPYLRGPRLPWTVASVALTAALALAGATPVRIIAVLALWGFLTPVPPAPQSESP